MKIRGSHTSDLRAKTIALAIAAALHAGLLLWMLKAPETADTDSRDRISVRLLDGPVAEPDLPQPAPALAKPIPPPSARVYNAPRAAAAPSVSPSPPTTATPEPATSLQVFNADGSIGIPAEPKQAMPANHFAQTRITPSAKLAFAHPLKIRPNYFSAYWRERGWEPLEDFGDFFDRKIIKSIEFRDSSGTRYICEWVVLFVSCIDLPPETFKEAKEPWRPASVLDEK